MKYDFVVDTRAIHDLSINELSSVLFCTELFICGGFVDISNKMTMTSMGVVVNFDKLRARGEFKMTCAMFSTKYAIFIDSSTKDSIYGNLFT